MCGGGSAKNASASGRENVGRYMRRLKN